MTQIRKNYHIFGKDATTHFGVVYSNWVFQIIDLVDVVANDYGKRRALFVRPSPCFFTGDFDPLVRFLYTSPPEIQYLMTKINNVNFSYAKLSSLVIF